MNLVHENGQSLATVFLIFSDGLNYGLVKNPC